MLHGPAYYAHEKLITATHGLATGPGDVRERLYAAYLSFHTLTVDDFPDHLKADWSWVMAQLTKFGPVYHDGKIYRGAVEETLRRIKRATGVKIAKKLVHLQGELDSYIYPR